MWPFGNTTWELVPVADVNRDELWALYQRHFDAERRYLEQTLGLAQIVACFRDRRTRELRGMATFCIREAECQGRRVHWFWMGGAALDRECRGQWLFERAALWALLRFRFAHPFAAFYSVCVSISFNSFRLAARNLGTYWPHPTRATPPWEQALLDLYCEEVRTCWDPDRKVTVPTGRRSVRPDSRRASTTVADPLRRFFNRINPHADRGCGVVVIAPLNLANLLRVLAVGVGGRGLGMGSEPPGG